MSIKGSFMTLYAKKQRATIIDFIGNDKKIFYKDLSRIEYAYANHGEGGYLDFVYPTSTVARFSFRKRANDKVLKVINYIEENYPDLPVTEHTVEEMPFYQRTMFVILLMMFCCAPIGLFMMWYYKKFSKPAMTIITTLFIATWCAGIYASYYNYTTLVNEMNDVFNQSYTAQLDQIGLGSDPTDPADVSGESVEKQSYSTTLTAGHYLVGTDIPVGTYSFYSKKGTGNLFSDDGSVNAIFDYDNEAFSSIGLENFGTEELNNIYLDEGVVLSVTGTQQISAGCSDGLVNSMTPRNQEGLQEIELGYGHYGASDDIPAGTYDVEWIEGHGNIICSSSLYGGINEIMGDGSADVLGTEIHIKNFRNLTLEVGDVLEIDDIKVKLTPSK